MRTYCKIQRKHCSYTLLLVVLAAQVLEDGLAGDAAGAYRVVRTLHFGHVREARRAADQTAARERKLGNALHAGQVI